jgi:hypothetical protein
VASGSLRFFHLWECKAVIKRTEALDLYGGHSGAWRQSFHRERSIAGPKGRTRTHSTLVSHSDYSPWPFANAG